MTIRIDQKTDSAQTPGGEGSKSSHSAAVMKTTLIGAATLLGLLAATRAEGSPILYTTTDLGTNSQLLTGADGHAYGVLGSTGVTYAFDKAPVTAINLRIAPTYGSGDETVLTMQDGAYQVGYSYTHRALQGGDPYYPSFMGVTYGWNNVSGAATVTDLNLQGQVVGQGLIYGTNAPFAAFSAVGAQTHLNHPGNASIEDNLNNYIATITGVSLTSTWKIDDIGRILANGSDGHSYLLTPTALGAATVPEPSTALMFGLAGSLFGLRSLARRTRQREAAPFKQAMRLSSKE